MSNSPKVVYKNRDEMRKWVGEQVKEGSADIQTDEAGQVIVYTGVFLWKDGSYRHEPDPKFSEDEEDDRES